MLKRVPVLFSCLFILSLLLSVPLGIAVAFVPARNLAVAALVSAVLGLPLGIIETAEALHRPEPWFAYVGLSVTVTVVSLAVLSMFASRLSRRTRALGSLLAATALLGTLTARHNPWSRYGVCLLEDYPGATDRFRTFTPVKCEDPAQHLGESMGADYAVLRFDDVDHDGEDDLVVMESEISCGFSASYCPAEQTLQSFRLVRTGPLRVEPIESLSSAAAKGSFLLLVPDN